VHVINAYCALLSKDSDQFINEAKVEINIDVENLNIAAKCLTINIMDRW